MKNFYFKKCESSANEAFEALLKSEKKIALAESCTGGLISFQFSRINGASRVFLGGVVSYSVDSKCAILGVPRALIERFTPYSVEVVEAMLNGTLRIFNADIALATSGIAGPNVDSSDFHVAREVLQDSNGARTAQVGDVFMGIKARDKTAKIVCEHFNGAREEIQMQASARALRLIREYLHSLA